MDAGGANPYNDLACFVAEPVIGEGTWIGPFCLIDGSGGLVIGRGCDLAGGVHVYTHSTARRCVSDRAVPIERRPVRIGDCTFIGANAVILMGVTIGSHCVIGAGAVVSTDVPDFGVAVGIPARVVGTVDSRTGAIYYAERAGSHAAPTGLHAAPAGSHAAPDRSRAEPV
jgi:acetyltransferase-like isoleucine patch superfamily enzyme